MAIATGLVLEVRQISGDDTFGGGYIAGAAGTDRSQSNSAFVVIDNATITATSAASTVTFTGGTYTATSADVGNLYNDSGTNGSTAGFYQIVSITSSTWVLDRAIGTSTGLVGKMGGALKTLNKAAAAVNSNCTAGLKIFVKENVTYSAAATAFSLAQTPQFNLPPNRIIGYGSTRGDGTQPVITLSGSATRGVNCSGNGWWVENINVNCNSVASSIGIWCQGAYSSARKCFVKNFTGNGIRVDGGSGSTAIENEITLGTSASNGALFVGSGTHAGNRVHDNACLGVNLNSAGATLVNNEIVNNTGASSDGVQFASYANVILSNTIHGNGRDGIRGTGGYNIGHVVRDNLITGHAAGSAAGLRMHTAAGIPADSQWDGNVYWNNTVNRVNSDDTGTTNAIDGVSPYANTRDVTTLTETPYVNSAGNNFSLNWSAAGGMKARAAGFPGTEPAGNTTGYPDAGCYQHKDDGGLVQLAQPAVKVDGVAVSTLTLTPGASTTAGNTLVVAVFQSNNGGAPSISGYTLAGSDTTNAGVTVFYKQNAASISTLVVNTYSTGRVSAVLFEIAGLPTSGTIVDQVVTGHVASSVATTATTSAYTTTTPQQALLVFWSGDDATNSPSDLTVPSTTTHYYPIVSENGVTTGPSYAAGIKVVDAIQTSVTHSIGLYAASAVNVGYVVLTLSAAAIGGGGSSTGAPFSRIFTGQ